MKFYLHFDGPPDYTMVFKWQRSEKGNLKLLLEKFLEAFNAKYASFAELSSDNTTLVDKKKTTLSLEKDISSIVKDGMDLFVVFKQCSKTKDRQKSVLDSLKQSTVSSVCLDQALSWDSEKMATTPTSPSAKSSSEENNSHNSSFCLKNLLRTGTMRNAARICAEALAVEEKNSSALSCLAEIYLKAGRPKIALEYIQLAVQVNPSDLVLNFMLGNCLLEVGKLDEATDAYVKYMDHLESTAASKSDIHNVQAAIAKVCAKKGNTRMAAELFLDVLKENATHIESMRGFALNTAGNSQEDLHEAIPLILAALVQSNGNRELKRQAGKLISQPGGMGVFENQLSQAWESSESMMYMADILRESGAIMQALELVNHAHQLSSHDPSICLYLIHTYEILNEHNKAFLEARAFLKRNSFLKIGQISCSQFVSFLEQITQDIYLNNAPVKVLPKLENQQDVGKALESEFHQLGLLFTLVKIFFVKGALNLVEALLPILDKVHKDRELHLTLLRNEAAFYSCISHVMQVPFSPMPSNPQFIYFASDSHCLSPAWRIIEYCDKPHVIHPVLATGVKIWHIRKDSCFYPKFTLLNALKEVPNGSTVIFNIGEIDCREGLLRAVDDCKYDTVEEAIKATVDIYISFLKEQQEQRGFVTFVHPILPVLQETRSTVLEFNEKLKSGVENCRGLHWLEFMDILLVNGGSEFHSQYKLDGTHVHPSYVSLLAKALDESLQNIV